jgi:Na+-transporting NADH:ubiquinone oxidoreductase subunit B
MGLRSTLDKLEPQFKPGGRYENWYALYEAVDTIFYSPNHVTRSSAHVRDGVDLKRIMITVWFATFPAMFYGMWNLGFQANGAMTELGVSGLQGWRGSVMTALAGYDASSVWSCFLYGALHFLPLYLVTFVVGAFWEVLFAMKRGHEVNEGFFVTSVLFALTLPPDLPLWQAA